MKPLLAKYLYDPFGNILSLSGPLAQINRYQFSSKECDINSGLVYFLYRFYDANLQRWLNRDPIGEAGGINLYEQLANCPTRFTDPFGLDPGFWGLWGNGLNNTVSAIGQGIGQGLYDLSHGQWSGDQWNRIGNLMYSVGTPENPDATPYVAGALSISGAAAVTAGIAPIVDDLATNLKIDGPAARGGRICQLRWGSTPLLRLDYHPIPGSNGKPVLHLNIGPGQGSKSIHVPIWPLR